MDTKNPNDLTDEECKWLLTLFASITVSGTREDAKRELAMLDAIETKLKQNLPPEPHA